MRVSHCCIEAERILIQLYIKVCPAATQGSSCAAAVMHLKCDARPCSLCRPCTSLKVFEAGVKGAEADLTNMGPDSQPQYGSCVLHSSGCCSATHKTDVFCSKQVSMESQHDAEEELGGKQDINHGSCLAAQGLVEEHTIEIIGQRKEGRQQGSSVNEGVDEEGKFHRVKRRERAQQDVAGCLKADRQNLRTAELELLLQVTACPPTA